MPQREIWDDKEVKRQQRLTDALRNRLEAVAARTGKAPLDARIAMVKIFAAIEDQKRALVGVRPSKKYQEHIWKWRNDARKMTPDFAAAIVRIVRLRMGIGSRKRREQAAIQLAVGVTSHSLSTVEARAARMLMGEGRITQNPHDKANEIARAARAEWGSPAIYPRQRSPQLSLEKVILTAVPFIEDLSDKKLRGTTPKSNEPIEMEPPEFGALMALVQIYKAPVLGVPNEEPCFEYVNDILTKYRAQHIEIKE